MEEAGEEGLRINLCRHHVSSTERLLPFYVFVKFANCESYITSIFRLTYSVVGFEVEPKRSVYKKAAVAHKNGKDMGKIRLLSSCSIFRAFCSIHYDDLKVENGKCSVTTKDKKYRPQEVAEKGKGKKGKGRSLFCPALALFGRLSLSPTAPPSLPIAICRLMSDLLLLRVKFNKNGVGEMD